MMTQFAYGIEECKGLIVARDVPCMIISTWDYANCTIHQANIYNSTPSLVSIRNFTRYGNTSWCNFTWNISDKGSYKWNVTHDNDTGKLFIEEDDTMSIALSIGLCLFALLFIAIGFLILNSKSPKNPGKK